MHIDEILKINEIAEEVDISSFGEIVPMIKSEIKENEQRRLFPFRLKIRFFESIGWKLKLSLELDIEFKNFDVVSLDVSRSLNDGYHHFAVSVFNYPPCEFEGTEIKDLREIVPIIKGGEKIEIGYFFNLKLDHEDELVIEDALKKEISNLLNEDDVVIAITFYCSDHKCHHIDLKIDNSLVLEALSEASALMFVVSMVRGDPANIIN